MALAKTQPLADQAKALGQQVGKVSLTTHPRAKGCTVEPATAAGPQLVQNCLFLAGIVLIQPVTEQRRQLVRQAQQDIVGATGASVGSRFDDLLQLGFIEPRDHRGCQHANPYPGAGQLLDHFQATGARAGSWFKLASQGFIQGRHRHHHLTEPLSGEFAQQVEIAQYHGAFGDKPHRMAMGQHHFQQLTGETIALLNRLVGVGIGADDDALWLIRRFGKLPAQQLGCIELGKQFGFEIEARGELQIGVAGPCIAIDAAVFAPLIGVDGAAKRHIR